MFGILLEEERIGKTHRSPMEFQPPRGAPQSRRCGVGKWAAILRSYQFERGRTAQDLADAWAQHIDSGV